MEAILVKKLLVLPLVGLLALLIASQAVAAPSYTLFGNATIVTGGNPGHAAQLPSTCPTGYPTCFGDASFTYSGVSFAVPAGLTFASLTTLRTDYNVTDDDCGGGSPRFQIDVDADGDGDYDGTIDVNIGPSPNFVGCATGWQSTGNLIGNVDSGRYDFIAVATSPVPSINFSTYPVVLTALGSAKVMGIQLVVDSGWVPTAGAGCLTGCDGEQTILADNVAINVDLYTFEPNTPATKDDCKNGDWQARQRDDFSAFKNQGDCIQYVNTGK
jgi:hypothetical protein